jgi:hypothetical protein
VVTAAAMMPAAAILMLATAVLLAHLQRTERSAAEQNSRLLAVLEVQVGSLWDGFYSPACDVLLVWAVHGLALRILQKQDFLSSSPCCTRV